jgi:mannosyltransferase OCH1-like enzyme
MDKDTSPKIPKVLHQIWWTGQLPQPYAEWRAGWVANHSGWIHRLYDQSQMIGVVKDRAPHWSRTFSALPRMIQKIDFFRYLIVYLDGGLYADVDMISYLPCDPLLSEASCVLSIEHRLNSRLQAELGYKRPWQFANFVFAAAPGHPFFAALLESIAQQTGMPAPSDDCVEELTGPRLLTRLAYTLSSEQRGEIRILPQVHLNPPFFYPRLGPLARNIYARHLCAGDWRTQADSRPWSRRRLPKGPFPNPLSTSSPFLLD